MNGPQIRFHGNVVRTPDIRYTNNEGKPYTRISVAVDTYRGAEREKDVDYFDVMFWGEKAERIAPMAEKGRWVYVEGVLHRDDYVNETDGAKYTSLRVQGREFMFLEPGQQTLHAAGGTSEPERSPESPPPDEPEEPADDEEEEDEDY